AREHSADVDAERGGELGGAPAKGAWSCIVLGDGREQLTGFLPLALLGERQRGHLPGAAEPRLTGLGERFEAGDHFLRLELVEFEGGLADERGIAVRLWEPTVTGGRLVGCYRGLGIALLERHRGTREHGRCPDCLAATVRQLS